MCILIGFLTYCRYWRNLAAALVVTSLSVESAVAVDNFLSNGSFELGLGAEPFYPGWRIEKSAYAGAEIPPLPLLDSTVAHSGKQSLKLSRPAGSHILFLDFQSPVIRNKAASFVSLWVKASRPDVNMIIGLCPVDGKGRDLVSSQKKTIGTEWQRIEYDVPPASGVVPLRMEIAALQTGGFDVWIDDVCWSSEKNAELRPGLVDLVLLPQSRNGMWFAGAPVILNWSADASVPKEIILEAKVTDLGRREELAFKLATNIKIGRQPSQGKIDLGMLKRGAYWADVIARDPATGNILATAHERFTVMANLKDRPAPVNFDVGYHGGIEFGKDMGFSWRGYWSLDEFFAINFQTGFRINRDIWDWRNIEPLPGQYVWDELDSRIDAAYRNGCSVIVCVPHSPLNMTAEEYRQISDNPAMDQGRWIYKTAKEINDQRVRSTPMNGKGGPKLLFAPDPAALTKFMVELAKRYNGKLAAIEFINEANLFITPKGLIEYYFKPVYPELKKVAPNLPVLMNQTMDFAADGNGYTGQFLAQGGFQYLDGITHHPYGASLLEDNGLPSTKTLEKLSQKYSRPDKAMVLGMTEIHGIGDYSFLRGEPVQRALIDWSVGCRWSAGVLLAYTNFYEGTGPKKWTQRGAFAPGVAAVQMNALYAVLGGYRFSERIELDNSVLIAAFDRTQGKEGERFAVALTAANIPVIKCTLEVDLNGIDVATFDRFGEPMPLPSRRQVDLGPDVIYLKSNDSALLQRLKAGRIVWSQALVQRVEVPKGTFGTPSYTSIYTTGLPPLEQKKIGVIRQWSVLNGVPDGSVDASPQKLGLVNADGALIWPQEQIRQAKDPLPYVVLMGRPPQAGQSCYAYTVLRSEEDQLVSLYFSATGPSTLWINGKPGPVLTGTSFRWIGDSWQKVEVPLHAGINHLLVKVSANESPCVFALSTDPEPALSIADGFVRRWMMVGPWKNPRNPQGEFQGNTTVFPPEEKVDWNGYYTGMDNMPLIWHEEVFDKPVIPHPWINAVSYGFSTIEVANDVRCVAALGSDDGYSLWINGELAGRRSQSRALKVDEEKLPVKLKKGRNTILFKIEDRGGGGAFAIRFLDENGAPVPWIAAP